MESHNQTIDIAKPNRPRRRWLKRIASYLAALLIIAFCAQKWRHYTLQKRLDEALAELDRAEPGWRLPELEAAREQVPEEENSARIVVAAGELVPRNWPHPQLDDRFDQMDSCELLNPNDFTQLTQELEKIRPTLEAARKLLDMPRGRHHIAYHRNVLNTPLDDQAKARRVAFLFAFDALRHSQNGDGLQAVTSCRTALHAARSLGDEPTTISQLIRMACVLKVCHAIEKTLGQSEPPPEKLTELQHALQSEDAHPYLLISRRGERAMYHALFEAVESGDVPLAEVIEAKWNWLERTIVSLWGMDRYEDHCIMLAMLTRAVANARLPMHEQIEAELQLDRETQALRKMPRLPLLTGVVMPKTSQLGNYSRRTHACIRATMAALAAERYRQTRGAWPESIDKLCPQFLRAVPLDPFDGAPLRYRRLGDGVVIYSVGEDGIDDGGTLDRLQPDQPGVDLGCRLWDAAKRRQPEKMKPNRAEGTIFRGATRSAALRD